VPSIRLRLFYPWKHFKKIRSVQPQHVQDKYDFS
jgi:hypothetical protein